LSTASLPSERFPHLSSSIFSTSTSSIPQPVSERELGVARSGQPISHADARRGRPDAGAQQSPQPPVTTPAPVRPKRTQRSSSTLLWRYTKSWFWRAPSPGLGVVDINVIVNVTLARECPPLLARGELERLVWAHRRCRSSCEKPLPLLNNCLPRWTSYAPGPPGRGRRAIGGPR
jgi:hypothetical protein